MKAGLTLGVALAVALASRSERPTGAGSAQRDANPLRDRRLWVNPDNPAKQQADRWDKSRAADAAIMRRMAAQPEGVWLGDWNRDIRGDVDAFLSRAAGAVPIFVAYNIPYRDCGLYSRGGSSDADRYRRWVMDLARGIRNRPAVVILEPDAAAGADCLPVRLREERFVLLHEATDALKKAGAIVYIDAGHAAWRAVPDMRDRLKRAGIDIADGFAINVSNFQPTSSSLTYGDALSRSLNGKHYVIDTGRNGRGVVGSKDWCNPPGQALGNLPTVATGSPLADAYLWIKVPGQSDGTCNGGPRAGEWWPEYALGLGRSAEALGGVATR